MFQNTDTKYVNIPAKFEDFIIENKIITKDELKEAIELSRKNNSTITKALVEKGILREEVLAKALANYYKINFELPPLKFDSEIINKFPIFTLKRYKIIPLSMEGTNIKVATSEPGNLLARDEIKRITKMEASFVCTTETAIEEALNRINQKNDSQVSIKVSENRDVIQIIDRLIERAIGRLASDIHIEPGPKEAIIRERIDGTLHDADRLSTELYNPVISRLKLMCGMDIVEKRIAQDGRMSFKSKKYPPCEIRASTLPTKYGEKMVLRLLASQRQDPNLDMLNVGKSYVSVLRKICQFPDGLILIAGPTGSGKTTTIYAMLSELDKKTQNLVTVEDPVEYEMERANQVQVNSKIGITFSNILPYILRQDPDIIMVGEVRDEETAQMVMRAAISGHLVFSTIHAPTALGTISRILDMGVLPHMLTASLKACISQRLIRRLCDECKKSKKALEKDKKILGVPLQEELTIFEPVGCPSCHNLGYKGRFAAMEILLVNEEIGDAIIKKDRALIAELAKKSGFKTIFEHASQRVINGETSLDEILAQCPWTITGGIKDLEK